MRKPALNLFSPIVGGLFGLLVATQVAAQSREQITPLNQLAHETRTKPQRSAEMNAEAKAAAPGPAHAILLKRVGEYTTSTKFWITPGTKPTESTGTARIWSVLDGRFIVEENTGNLVGMPTKGISYYGYNNGSGKYEAIWTYTMSTAIMTLSGTSADGGKTVNYTAAYDDATGARQTLYVTTTQMDDDRFTVGLSAKNPDGTKGATVETTYVRRK
jgi:hypothetical protein